MKLYFIQGQPSSKIEKGSLSYTVYGKLGLNGLPRDYAPALKISDSASVRVKLQLMSHTGWHKAGLMNKN